MTDATPQPDPAAPQPAAPLSESDDNLYASLSHFLNIIPLIPALIFYFVFGPRGPRTRVESKEALNWTINVTGALIAISIVSAILGWIPFIGWILALLLSLASWAIVVVNIVFAIMGGLRVQAGGSWRYPVNIRWIK